MKMKNEEALQRVQYLDMLDRAVPQTGKLGYAIAVNKRKMAEAVQEYSEMKNKKVGELREELDYKEDDPEKVKQEKQATMDKRLTDELGDVAWIEQDIGIMQVSEEEMYNGTLNSVQMSGLLWMVKEDK